MSAVEGRAGRILSERLPLPLVEIASIGMAWHCPSRRSLLPRRRAPHLLLRAVLGIDRCLQRFNEPALADEPGAVSPRRGISLPVERASRSDLGAASRNALPGCCGEQRFLTTDPSRLSVTTRAPSARSAGERFRFAISGAYYVVSPAERFTSMSRHAVNTLIVLGACVVYIVLGLMSGRTSINGGLGQDGPIYAAMAANHDLR